ncbi:MAG: DUF1127 domain-containing protein [Pseudomonadota bacterium]
MSTTSPSTIAAIEARSVTGLPRYGRLKGIVALFFYCQDRLRTRRRLAALPPHLLADIGVSREEALDEASKPFWS